MGIFMPLFTFQETLHRLNRVMRIRFFVLLAVLLFFTAAGIYLVRSGMYRYSIRYCAKLFEFIEPGKPAQKKRPLLSAIENNILDRLKFLEIADSSILYRSPTTDTAIRIRAAVPRGNPVEWTIWHLSSAVKGTSYHIEDSYCPSDGKECNIRFVSSAPRERPVILTILWASRFFSKTAKMAIVIRDFGFAADQTTIEYLSFPEPLTVALLPSRRLSSWTAQISNEYKKEILILLPMEPIPSDARSYRQSCVMIHYPEDRLRSIITDASGAIPNYAGFCNAGGARVLEDSRVTNILFSEIKKKHGFFVEQLTTRKSVASAVARKLSVPFAQIDCCIDSSMNASRIQEILKHCAKEAQKRGRILISSKPTGEFIRALNNELPLLLRNGIQLSYVSEIFAPVGRTFSR